MRYGKRIDIHSFYCIKCGEKALDCVRPLAKQRERFHYKKLYCPWCKITLNCVECCNDIDVFEFKEAFNNGEYKEELEKSMQRSEAYGENISDLGSALRA